MKRRIFIAVNLPENVKKELAGYQLKWPELPIRWTKKENLHITLEFLGYLADEEIAEVCREVKEIASKHKPFSVTLNRIAYGPPKKMPPRMIWAVAAPPSGASLALFGRGENIHITLGRIRTFEWRRIEPEERPAVEEDIHLTFEVNSIEVMESKLKRSGPDYIVLESCPLKN